MEEQDMTRLPNEVVEIYRQPPPGEVVEQYSRPLPGVPRREAQSAAPSKQARRKHSKKGLWIFLGCAALAAVLAAAAVFWDWSVPRHNRIDPFDFDFDYRDSGEDRGSQEIAIPAWPAGQGCSLPVVQEHGPSLTAQEVYRQVNPAVAVVLADLGDGSASVGTGVIFSQDGYLITNYHVVEGGQECTVALDSGRSYEAKYVAGDADSDLAVLKVEGQDLPAAVFGDSDLLTVGDKVYAIGNPLGVELRGTLTDGIVSAIDRDVEVEDRTMTLLQTNAALNSGNSGGPLINEYGQVVGINTIKMTSRYSNIEGLGFAIPSAYMERIVNDLLTFGSLQPEPVLGITVLQMAEQVEPDVWGIEVQSVTENSPAGKAGVQEGDYVLSAGGRDINSSRDLLRVRRQHHLGDELPMTLWRDGEIIEITLSLTEPAA
ncbi:S1C family serine protease [uncultured Oscillibacter sp.]|jgi:serine protease Do|uniref:S1C family serine protease n=1 Tax=uncultured Oscillibacter sp. TaxID=876091 RepID=UPI0025CCFA3F|nr:trypsin-like peptidase domain-containing protein [uncultured Oscillibacter sp.]